MVREREDHDHARSFQRVTAVLFEGHHRRQVLEAFASLSRKTIARTPRCQILQPLSDFLLLTFSKYAVRDAGDEGPVFHTYLGFDDACMTGPCVVPRCRRERGRKAPERCRNNRVLTEDRNGAVGAPVAMRMIGDQGIDDPWVSLDLEIPTAGAVHGPATGMDMVAQPPIAPPC